MQECESTKFGAEAHDETLFIIVHQVYELWFKQILHEIHSIIEVFSEPVVADQQLSVCVARLERIIAIQNLLLQQLNVMETMRPMDFLEFRDLLTPASGFQSVQFREIETLFGLSLKQRGKVDRTAFLGRLSPDDRQHVETLQQQKSLFDLVDAWLERMPYSKTSQFDFWKEYAEAVQVMLENDRETIMRNPLLSEEEKARELINLDGTANSFNDLLDAEKYAEHLASGERRFSDKAMLNALFIFLYREEPQLSMGFRLLNALVEIDGNFTSWRQRHALMAHRMLGGKIGTGGSAGHQYLKAAAENNRVYTDLYDIATFLIPRSCLPQMPETLRAKNV